MRPAMRPAMPYARVIYLARIAGTKKARRPIWGGGLEPRARRLGFLFFGTLAGGIVAFQLVRVGSV